MPGIAIPRDRTTKQQARAYCFNPACRELSTDSRFEFDTDHDHAVCPKCGADHPGMVGLLVLIHLLILDHKGPILGSGGRRYKFACDQHRSHLATPTNLEAATGDIESANCLGCLKALHDDDLAHATRQGKPASVR